jgi:SAM-dependent methyltransferase
MISRSPRLFSSSTIIVLAQLSTMSGFIEEQFDAIPYVPTPNSAVDRMLQIAGVGPGDLVLDMGSGDGRIVIAAAQLGARGRGVEINPDLVERSKRNAERAKVSDRTEFLKEDMFTTPLNDVSVLTLYVLTQSNLKLRPRILSEMRPGTRVISHQFGMQNWEPDRFERHGFNRLFLWYVPARVGGRWRFESGDDHFTLEIAQEFQQIQGAAHFGNKPIPIRNARLQGAEIDFEIDRGNGEPLRFSGIVADNTITPRGGGQWRAIRVGAAQAIAK